MWVCIYIKPNSREEKNSFTPEGGTRSARRASLGWGTGGPALGPVSTPHRDALKGACPFWAPPPSTIKDMDMRGREGGQHRTRTGL